MSRPSDPLQPGASRTAEAVVVDLTHVTFFTSSALDRGAVLHDR